MVNYGTYTIHTQGWIQDSMKGGSFVKKSARLFKVTPTRALTTPIFDQGWRVLSVCRPCTRIRSKTLLGQNLFVVSEVGGFYQV